MSVGLLIISHSDIGANLLNTATSMLGLCPLQTSTLAVSQSCAPENMLKKARRKCKALDQGDGVLVLTDIYGSTPSNIANRLRDQQQVQIVAGINLPMLIRVLNYPDLNLHELVTKALSGGHDGVMLCEPDQ